MSAPVLEHSADEAIKVSEEEGKIEKPEAEEGEKQEGKGAKGKKKTGSSSPADKKKVGAYFSMDPFKMSPKNASKGALVK